jgi:hypothetical protein
MLVALSAHSLLRAQPNQTSQPAPQLRVSCEWIALPHAEANRLIRSLTSSSPQSGNAMHEAAQQLVAAGKGQLLQQQFLTTTSGLKAKTGTLRHFPYPTEYDPPEVSTKVVVQGGNVLQGDFKKAEPTSFETKQLGFDLEIEPTVDDSSRFADLNLAATWTTHAGDQVWGQGIAEITQPVFQRCALSAQALCEHDTWKLVALLRPAVPGPGTAAQPMAEERVLVFFKAFIEGHGPPPVLNSSAIKEIGVLCEWVELDAADADQLMDSIPASGQTEGLRTAAQALLDSGKATLSESAYLLVRGGQKSKLESVLEFPYPTEFDQPNLPETIIELPAPVPAPPITHPVFWPTPGCPQSFNFKNLGTTAEIEAEASDDGITLDLTPSPEICRLVGIQPHGQGNGFTTQPRFATIKSGTRVLVKDRQPALINSYEAMPPASLKMVSPEAPPAGDPNRRILLFVTAWRR